MSLMVMIFKQFLLYCGKAFRAKVHLSSFTECDFGEILLYPSVNVSLVRNHIPSVLIIVHFHNLRITLIIDSRNEYNLHFKGHLRVAMSKRKVVLFHLLRQFVKLLF